RDLTVTGVQTCALPICGRRFDELARDQGGRGEHQADAQAQRRGGDEAGPRRAQLHARCAPPASMGSVIAKVVPTPTWLSTRMLQIGRASCRERVEVAVG